MSVATLDLRVGPAALPGVAMPATRMWWQTACLFAVLGALSIGAWLVDDRLLNGVSVWSKPLKFQASLGLHFATLALLAPLLSRARMVSRAFHAVVYASVAAALFEIGWIMIQAARGRASHFNDQTLLDNAMYALMGVGALVLVAAPFLLGVWLWRDYRPLRRADPLRLAAATGLILSAVATLIVAGYMSHFGSHWVGQTASDAGGLAILGWSREVGDLRVPHFFATHAMQALPLLGFVLRGAGTAGCRWVLGASAFYMVFTAAVFVQALLGRPFVW